MSPGPVARLEFPGSSLHRAGMDERFLRLEEKIAHLERHVVEQDKAMLELTEQLARLRAALLTMRERLPENPTSGEVSLEEDRPPHY